jgi:hypothetical protein
MVRLRIKFDQVSPYLRVMSGILYVEKVDTTATSDSPMIELFRCKVKKEYHSTGYSISHENSKGIPSKLFKCLKPIIDTMLRSYWNGMVLEKEDFTWVRMEGDDSYKRLNQLGEEVANFMTKELNSGSKYDEL